MYIAVAGNIGCGKTSLVESLTKYYGLKPYYENIDNPYLDDFYKDMATWSFKLQISFLSNKIIQMNSICDESCNVIQDRTVYEEGEVFVKNLLNMGLMTNRDYKTYKRIYSLLVNNSKKPDLLIYLKGSVETLVAQIKKRGRSYEQNIRVEYLEKLQFLYDEWVDYEYQGDKLVIDIDNIDYVDNELDFKTIVKLIENKLDTLSLKLTAVDEKVF